MVSRHNILSHRVTLAGLALWGALLPHALEAANPSGQFLTITSPVDDVLLGRVSNAALKLQADAVQNGQKSVLVLQIMPGSSPFHQIQGLASFLASDQLSQVTTVAWIPENFVRHIGGKRANDRQAFRRRADRGRR